MSRGWFTLFLYSESEEAQSTEVDIEVSRTVGVDISKYTHANASIDADHGNINIAAQTALDAEIEVSNMMHIDIGKVSPFEGDE
ncbi:hypothetical protein [Catenibacterium mitsuokai]|uniref:hypothetical protein n=1 Tax=Catenibacterium mitsuokai TaxID=100886 RepID=UPI00319E2BC2